MNPPEYDIQIISAPSVLGLKPSGVQDLAKSLLTSGLAVKLNTRHPVLDVPTLNHLYSSERDKETNCLNAIAIRDFSLSLGKVIADTKGKTIFPFVLGGDCSILLGIMPGLKTRGTYGIIFFDAHADFYEPERSVTGEVADMDLAIITGRGPKLLTDINNQHPYVMDENVIHIGQRDEEETKKYRSRDIRETSIKCIPFAEIATTDLNIILNRIVAQIKQSAVDGFWIHFDTDVLCDEINPAVDYRLRGGIGFEQAEQLLNAVLRTGKIAGISVTIFNPALDNDGQIATHITESLGRAFNLEEG